MNEGGFDDLRGSGAFRSMGGAEATRRPAGTATPEPEIEPARVERLETTTVQPAPAPPRASGTVPPETEIEQTRAELSETIEAIQDRLAPRGSGGEATGVVADASERSAALAREIVEQAMQEATKQAKLAMVDLSDQVKASVRAATIGKVERMATSTGEKAKQAANDGGEKAKQAASSGGKTVKGIATGVVTTVKQNPWPAALTALGIGWLVSGGGGAKGAAATQGGARPASSGNGSTGTDGDGGGSSIERAKETTTQVVEQARETVGAGVDQVGETAGEAIDTAGSVLNETASTVGSVLGSTAGTVGSALGSTASAVKSGATGLANGAQQQTQRVGELVTQSPLKVGVTTLALGGALGLALPVSRRETALIGETRDKAVDHLEQTAQQTLTKLQTVAGEAQDAAAKEAKYQGLPT